MERRSVTDAWKLNQDVRKGNAQFVKCRKKNASSIVSKVKGLFGFSKGLNEENKRFVDDSQRRGGRET